ncbi:hypothetical protein [Methylobacterium sp. Leaf85]|uniref:hypothetical protein n=1 Tax=Methylobacterium sp. Leaf85 TaxID=1736241 RepID=UPI0006F625EC|nr:hypothetical protein [Methylobacterium sp. Leaf85]KQO45252.1 hypothetical protein ASF08_23510 [Methylobacterium sp. Leaf85]
MRPSDTVITGTGTLTPEAANVLAGHVHFVLTHDESFAMQRILCAVSTDEDTAAGTIADTLLDYISQSIPASAKPFSASFDLASLASLARKSAIVRYLFDEEWHYHVHRPIARVLSLVPSRDITEELVRYHQEERAFEGETLRQKLATDMASKRAAELAPAIGSLRRKLADLV